MSDENFDQIDSLPSTELTKKSVERLQRHDSFEDVRPLAQRTDSPDEIIAMILNPVTQEQSVVVYNAETSTWLQVLKFTANNLTEGTPEEMDPDLIYQFYEEEEIELIHPSDSELYSDDKTMFPDLVASIPDEPLTDAVVDTVQAEHKFILNVVVMGTRGENGDATLLMIAYDDLYTIERHVGMAAFHPIEGHWWSVLEGGKELFTTEVGEQKMSEAIRTVADVYQKANVPFTLTEEDEMKQRSSGIS